MQLFFISEISEKVFFLLSIFNFVAKILQYIENFSSLKKIISPIIPFLRYFRIYWRQIEGEIEISGNLTYTRIHTREKLGSLSSRSSG